MTARATRRGLLTFVGAAPFAGPAAAIPAPHPDADLLRLCGEYVRLEVEFRRLSDETDVLTPSLVPGYDRLWTAYEANIALCREALDAIAASPARTRQGLAAKARALKAFYARDDGTGTWFGRDYPVQRAIWSLVEDAASGGAE